MRRTATARPGTARPDGKEAGRRSEDGGIEAGRVSEVAIALHDGVQDRGIKFIIMARRAGNEAHINHQGETEADLMSAGIGGIDTFLLHMTTDEAYHIKILAHDI